MATQASPAPPWGGAPRIPLWAPAAAAAGGVLAVLQPAAAVGYVVLLALVLAVRDRPLPAVAVVLTAVTALAALAGPNLAVPAAPGVFLFRVLIVVLGLGALLYVLLGGTLRWPAVLSLPAGLLGLLVAWAAASLAWSQDVVAAARWTVLLALPVAFGTRRRAIRLLVALGIAFGVVTLISLLEIVAGIRLPTSRLAGRSPDAAFAATSVFGNENNLATYLTLTLPYFLVLVVVFRDVRLRALGLMGGLACLLALLYTGSKSNLLATALVLAGLLVVLATDPRQRRRALSAAVVAGLAALVVVPALRGAGVVPLPERALDKFSFSLLQEQVEQGVGSGAVRSNLLDDGLALVVETGGVGVGAGNADVRIRSLADFPGVSNLHNWWLEVLVNLGLIGLALYVTLYGLLFGRQLRAARRTRDPLVRYLALAGAVSLVGFVAGSLGPSSVLTFAPLWITLGMGMLTLVLWRRAEAEGGRLR
jgi:teichuronic acid biosynthesis protein TuaE